MIVLIISLSEGKIPLGFSGLPQEEDLQVGIQKFLEFVVSSLERNDQLQNFKKNWNTMGSQFNGWLNQLKERNSQFSRNMNNKNWWN